MAKLKNRNEKIVISKDVKTKYEELEKFINKHSDSPIISFKHLTNNNEYNFKFFSNKNMRDGYDTHLAFHNRIKEIQSCGWKQLHSWPKERGLETIEAHQLEFEPKDYILSKDEKVIVIRFRNQDCRIIGKKENFIFHVFGFDFNYSAYNHG